MANKNEKEHKAKKSVSKKKKETAPADSGWKRVVVFICGIFFGFLTLYTLVSLVSFLFTWIEDQSIIGNADLISSVIRAENGGGKVGYFWSNFLVSKLFGFGAFVVPIFFGALTILCLRIRKINFFRLFFLSLMGCIILSMLSSYIFSFTEKTTLFGQGAGGSYGYYVNEWLLTMLGDFGTGALILFFLVLWIVLLDNKVIDYFNSLLDRLNRPKAQAAAAVEGEEGEEAGEGAGIPADGGMNEENPADGAEENGEMPQDGSPATAEGGTTEGGNTGLIQAGPVTAADGSTTVYELHAEQEPEADKKPEVEIEINMPETPTEPQIGVAIPAMADDDSEEESPAVQTGPAGAFPAVTPGLTAPAPVHPDADTPATAGSKTVNGTPVEIMANENELTEEMLDEQWREMYDPRLSLKHYKMPPLTLLENAPGQQIEVSQEELDRNSKNIVTTLNNYKIGITKISVRMGPTVTLYEVVPAPGVRVSNIKRLEDDIARSLAAIGVRVVSLVGTNAVGIEVANEKPKTVSMRSVLEDPKFKNSKYDLPIVIGKTILNETMTFDLAKMPHILIAGATGQGKSVGLNAIITSLLYKKHPAELKLVLVDPKKVELSLYSPLINHFLAKLPEEEEAILTDTQKVIHTLKSLCKLMDTRYDLLKAASVRNVKEYNEKFLSRKLNPKKGHDYMPYIVVIIDEFADLLVTAGREIEEPITRLAQLARAIGIHLVIATQRPTTNIITGTIKANFPARIAFKVFSSVDSKTILDQTGANHLIGRGDMLILTGSSEPTRVQCAFIDTPEVEKIANYIHSQQGFGLPYALPEVPYEDGKDGGGSSRSVSGDRDELFEEAARLIVREQHGSTSLIQRKMLLGYNRAGRIMDQLEAAGIVGPSEGSKARQVLITSIDSLEQILSNL